MNASVGAGTARTADLYADESASAPDAFVLRLIADSTDAESSPAIRSWFDNAIVGVIAKSAAGDCM